MNKERAEKLGRGLLATEAVFPVSWERALVSEDQAASWVTEKRTRGYSCSLFMRAPEARAPRPPVHLSAGCREENSALEGGREVQRELGQRETEKCLQGPAQCHRALALELRHDTLITGTYSLGQ